MTGSVILALSMLFPSAAADGSAVKQTRTATFALG